MKIESFQNMAARYAAVMGRRRDGVSVTFGGESAYTDGRHINIPVPPAGTTLTPWQAKVFRGYLDHETAHLRYTDFNAIQLDRLKEPILSYLTNLIEDVRIETASIREYPGTRPNLDALQHHVDQESEKAKREKNKPGTWGDKIIALLYAELYRKYRNVDSGFESDQLMNYPELEPIGNLLAQKMPGLQNTREARELAEEVEKLLPDVDYGMKPEPKDEVGGIIIFVFPGPGGNGQGNKDAIIVAVQGDDRSKAKMIVIQYLMESIEADNQKDDPKEHRRAKRDWGERILPPVTTVCDRIYVPAKKDRDAYEKTKRSTITTILAAKKMLRIFLQSRDRKAWSRGLDEGTLDSTQLHQLVIANDPKIMKERRLREMVDTIVELIVDCSSSMDQDLTRQAAIIMTEALAGVPRLKLGVRGFTTNDHHLSGKDGGRNIGMDLLTYKDPDEPLHQAKYRLGALRCGGYTPLGEAYGYALERILMRKESKKVIWLISDGDPYFSTLNHNHSELMLMRRIKNKAKRLGVITVGLYVGSQGSLRDYVERYAEISDCSQLPAAVLKIMKEISNDPRKNCFGFYVGGPTCNVCTASKRCKAILISHGFTIMGELTEALLGDLPDQAEFRDTDRVAELVNQLLQPPVSMEDDDVELVTLLQEKGITEIDVRDL